MKVNITLLTTITCAAGAMRGPLALPGDADVPLASMWVLLEHALCAHWPSRTAIQARPCRASAAQQAAGKHRQAKADDQPANPGQRGCELGVPRKKESLTGAYEVS